MNEELRLKSPSVFSEKTYTDEPIVHTAAQMKSYEPPEYREMRKIRFAAYEKGWSAEHVFYEQARFMENFEDDYRFEGTFHSFFPTYADMSSEQLRGYFTWRTRVRRGETPPAPASFAFVYIYELLNLIGVDGPEEGFFRLNAFFKDYIPQLPEISHYADTWLKDHIAFYDLDVSLFSAYCDLSHEKDIAAVMNCAQTDGRELFDALVRLCDYDIRESAFYKEHSREYAFAVCTAFREYAAKYDKTHKSGFAEKLFGRVCGMPYTVFGSAVFYDRTKTRDHETVLCENDRYTFTSGRCVCFRCWGRRGKSAELGAYVKYVESLLREAFAYEKPLKTECPAKPFEKIAKAAVEKAYKLAVNEAESEKRRYVDTSLLDGILLSADKTREKLITEEEREEECVVPGKEPETEPEKKSRAEKEEKSSLPVSPDELGFLKCLLNGENVSGYASAHGVKISLLCDGINEKLYDLFYDTVVDFDGDMPFIIEDYAEELREMTEG